MNRAGIAGMVEAAQAGDRQAQDDLVAVYLPLVYNIVGRALNGHADVDDVVQETMLRAVDGLPGLRDPASFRSWLVAIAMNQIRGHWQANSQASWREAPGGPESFDIVDPRMDFVEVTIVRLGLSGQRREVAEATRWLDADDRELLALWWLEAAGEVTRGELAAALELPPQHAAVRIQRMKGQLELSRVVVRALLASPRCYELEAHMAGWDGMPSPLWRKRFARHVRECAMCSGHGGDLVPAERLLVALAMVPPAAGLAALLAATRHAGSQLAAAGQPLAHIPHIPGQFGPPSGPQALPNIRTSHAHRRPRGVRHLAPKTLMGGAAVGLTAVVAVTAIVTHHPEPSPVTKGRATDSLDVTQSPTTPPSTATTPAAPAPDPSHSSAKPGTAPSTTPHPKPSTTPSTAVASAPPANATAVDQVLALVNRARADQGLPPLTITAGLTRSATAHNQVMASGCGMQHQCPGEDDLGTRISAAGVHWGAAGENIGEGGPVGTAPQKAADMAVALTQDMLNEKPPNDGHRRNILSSTFTHIGIAVFRDSKGTVWMTQDFSD